MEPTRLESFRPLPLSKSHHSASISNVRRVDAIGSDGVLVGLLPRFNAIRITYNSSMFSFCSPFYFGYRRVGDTPTVSCSAGKRR